MKTFKNPFLYAIAAGLLAFSACSKDPKVEPGEIEPPVTEEGYQYVIATSSGENSYLSQANSIDEGSINVQGGNAKQVVGSRSWYFYKDFAAYSFIYAQGDPGKTSSFVLNDKGELDERKELVLNKSLQVRGDYNDYIYAAFSSRSYTDPVATFYKIDTKTEVLSQEIPVNTENFTGNGEMAYFTDIAQYGDYVLAGVRTIKAGADGGTWTDTDFSDSTFVAVLDKDMKVQKVIRDHGRTGQVMGMNKSNGETGIEVVDNGDVYVFASAANGPDVPSGVLKINKGDLEFDEDYFFDISQASGGNKLWRVYYVGGSEFVLQMYTNPGQEGVSDGIITKFAVVDVVAKSFDWVTGVPTDITEIGVTPLIEKDKKRVVFPINTSGAYPHLYIVDAASKSMKKGLEVVAEEIRGVGKLKY